MVRFHTLRQIKGDRSLVSVIVHEIAHSWTGNLVSCSDCREFWMNEGFTVKLERRILRELYGTEREGLDAIEGREEMASYIADVGDQSITTCLVIPLKDGDDPDSFYSCIAYEKGYNFLMVLEQRVMDDYSGDFDGTLFLDQSRCSCN